MVRNEKMKFTGDFLREFVWREVPLRISTVTPEHKQHIADGLQYMSPESIRNRFLGSKRAFTDKELNYLTVLDGWNHFALGVEEREGKRRGVAIVRFVRSSEHAEEAEIAITIIDEYQRRGLGTFLLYLIVLSAIERGISRLSFTFLPSNEAILRLISKLGLPIRGHSEPDFVQRYLELKNVDQNEIRRHIDQLVPKISL